MARASDPFEFGPMMRALAQIHCAGKLPVAHSRYATAERLAQHERDLDAMPEARRVAYAELIMLADRSPESVLQSA